MELMGEVQLYSEVIKVKKVLARCKNGEPSTRLLIFTPSKLKKPPQFPIFPFHFFILPFPTPSNPLHPYSDHFRTSYSPFQFSEFTLNQMQYNKPDRYALLTQRLAAAEDPDNRQLRSG